MKKHIIYNIFLLVAIGSFMSCEKAFMEENPSTSALAIFDEYSKLVEEKYAMLDFKGVDISSLKTEVRATIDNNSSEEQLLEAIGKLTLSLRDAHSSIIADVSNPESPAVAFNHLEGFPPAININETLIPNYLGKDINPSIKIFKGGDSGLGFKIAWGTLVQDNEIGYIWVPSWNIEMTNEEIEQVFSDLKNTKGIILDLRLNSGGDPSLATKFASYFMSKPTPIGFERFKTGPGANDFSDSHITVSPSGSANSYLKPVIVLTDRNVYSASTTFLYSVDPLEQIKTVGQRTGGGSGSVADGFLANGWQWSLSTSEFIDLKGRHLDDGVDPDIPVELNNDDITKDELIERAILELQ